MNLGDLKYTLNETKTDFHGTLFNSEISVDDNFETIKNKINSVFTSAANYYLAESLDKSYFELAKKPLWVDYEIEPEKIIYRGFEALVKVDLNENISLLRPYVYIENSHVTDLKDGSVLEINDDFRKTMNSLQLEILDEAIEKLESRTADFFSKIWTIEKQRINKWIKVSKIKG